VFEDTYPVRWLGRQAVVTLPGHIDVARQQVSAAAERLEATIREIHEGASGAGGQDPPPHRPPPPGMP